jgi:lysophospholipase L1-like esterase
MPASRREFLQLSGAALVAARFHPAMARRRAGRRVLFQGDSITDAGRDRSIAGPNDVRALGAGYPLLLAAALRNRYPALDPQVFNRGISGNTVTDLTARWQTDTLDLQPDLLSILIGVNDIWHTRSGNYHGTVERYRTGYGALLANTRAALPSVTMVVLEPFVLVTGAVSADWFPEFDDYRAAAKTVAHDAHATFVPLHDMFQHLARQAPPSYWLRDGVHPTLAGHQAIAARWMEKVKLH